VRTIFGILFFVIFAVPGARLAGYASTELIATQRFDNPDQVAQFTTMIELGVTLAVALIGAVIGVWLAGRLKPVFFRKS
jgi:predicted cation transporter